MIGVTAIYSLPREEIVQEMFMTEDLCKQRCPCCKHGNDMVILGSQLFVFRKYLTELVILKGMLCVQDIPLPTIKIASSYPC